MPRRVRTRAMMVRLVVAVVVMAACQAVLQPWYWSIQQGFLRFGVN